VLSLWGFVINKNFIYLKNKRQLICFLSMDTKYSKEIANDVVFNLEYNKDLCGSGGTNG
jgi:hypothetical protein